jgi:signal transduction histidine kinase
MEALGRLAGGVAHDFNNLLTVILGYAAELRARLDAQNPLAASILEIERAASQAALVTGQLLAFSRKQVTRFDALDLNKVVDDIRDILARLVGEDIELHTHLDDSRPYIRGDGSQLTQVIMNLAANARDAMPIGGALTIETRVTERDQDSPGLHGARPAGKYAVLSVSDTG